MAGNILTPVSLWGQFKINQPVNAQVISERSDGEVVFSYLTLCGREVKDGQVKISAVLARKAQLGVAPACLLLQDVCFAPDERLMKELAMNGYTVLSVDFAGETDGKDRFTEYPESLSYAKYSNVKDLYTFDGDADKTCWYEWTVVARYALAYLKGLTNVTGVGAMAFGHSATMLWQVSAFEEDLACAVFGLNAGWQGYRKIYKFGGQVEPQFTDDLYKFIAGIEPQSYAKHVHCPVLMLSATNSALYDVDRAYDTVARLEDGVYRALDYSVGYRNRINAEGFKNALLFFDRFLMRAGSKGKNLPEELEIKCDVEDGKIIVEVMPDVENIKEVVVYASEQMANPALRSWNKISDSVLFKDGVYRFEYSPYPNSGMAVFFARATYKNGFSISSNVVAKKFTSEEVSVAYKSNIIYSSRIENAESVFTVAHELGNNPQSINVIDQEKVTVKKGPVGIEGVFGSGGLLTFKINAEKNKPNDDAMLMLDVYSEKDGKMIIKLIADYFGNKTEYIAIVNVVGGQLWQNVKLERTRFKTAEGLPLKSFSNINAMEFLTDSQNYLINNALWV